MICWADVPDVSGLAMIQITVMPKVVTPAIISNVHAYAHNMRWAGLLEPVVSAIACPTIGNFVQAFFGVGDVSSWAME